VGFNTQVSGFCEIYLFTFSSAADQINRQKSMAVLLTTSGGVYLWNLKELVPRKKFVSTGSDGVLCSAVSPNGIPAIT
jgi:hypothetical protein